ncbi:cystatin-related protein 2-like [Peromyscus maniculatus bairdii]|uniref:cystatin-related protein 2-like n=1 Tax=Peromyscus maniculatus bairdii TaxID=230844 RepID=UPI003FD267E7
MGKTLWSSLILQATLILLLDSSNVKRNYIDIIITYVLPEIPKQFALDIINIIYNLRSNGTYISKIMSDRLKGIRYMTYGEVELRRTTCTRAESALDECPLKPKFTQIHNLEFIYIYGLWSQNHKPCSKFLSELSNCSFSEHPDDQKKELGYFKISNRYY